VIENEPIERAMTQLRRAQDAGQGPRRLARRGA
jgi:hypothetical protein